MRLNKNLNFSENYDIINSKKDKKILDRPKIMRYTYSVVKGWCF